MEPPTEFTPWPWRLEPTDRLPAVVLLILLALGTASAAGLLVSDVRPVEVVLVVCCAALAAAGGAAILSFLSKPEGGSANAPVGYLQVYESGVDDGLLLVRADTSIVFSNAAFWRITGLDHAIPGRFRPSDDLKGLLAANDAIYRLSKADAEGRDWEEVVERGSSTAKDGAGRWLRISVKHPKFSASEAFSAWRVGDVTVEQNRRYEPLQRIRKPLETLDALPVGVFVCDDDGMLNYANLTLAGWLGLDRKDVEDRQVSFRHVVALAKDAGSSAQARLAPGAKALLDVELLQPDGGRHPALLVGRVGKSPDNFEVGALIESLPERPRTLTGEADDVRFARFFQSAPIAIATVQAQGAIRNCNPAFARMFFGHDDCGSIVGQDINERLSDVSRQLLRSALDEVLKGQGNAQPVEISTTGLPKRTSQLFLSVPAGGTGQGVLLYALDTTERKELEAQFAQSQKMQAIGQLAGGIAHDINNVLTVIIGFSDLLLANSAGDPALHDLNEIKANANRAANLVRQLLAFSRRQTLRPEILSLNEVISDLSIFLKRSLGEKVQLEREYGRDLWLVKADQTELGRVLVNLAVNAVDAMPNGGKLTIRTANVGKADAAKLGLTGLEPDDYVLCAVTDTGHGMTPDIMEKIFEPFFTTKDIGKGTGLGLSTVYGIVKQTGGYIYCRSTPDAGTTFSIFLPRHIAGSLTQDANPKPERKDRARDLTGTGTVLLVEDEESVRRFAARALRRQGYAVIEAGNGQEALDVKAAHKGSIDLVVSDIVMPEMDGPTLLKELRKSNPDLRIIFMSGYADDALSSLDGGEEFAFLAKPFQLTDLVAAVKEAMDR